VNNACRQLEVSHSAYYQRRLATRSARATSDAELTEKINAIHTGSKGSYGSPRVHRALRKAGTECGKRRVRRLMRQAGLEGRCQKRWRKTTGSDPAAEAAHDLIGRHFGVYEEVDRRNVGDITYIATWEGGPTWPRLSTCRLVGSSGGPWPARRGRRLSCRPLKPCSS
jgi:putative transposase